MSLDRRGFLLSEVVISLTLTVGAINLISNTLQYYRQSARYENLAINYYQSQFEVEYRRWVNDQPFH